VATEVCAREVPELRPHGPNAPLVASHLVAHDATGHRQAEAD
jgi:hypothetical protein